MSKQKMRTLTTRLIATAEDWTPDRWYSLDSYSVEGQAEDYFLKNILELNSDPSGIYLLRARNIQEFNRATGLSINRKIFYVGRTGGVARRLCLHLKRLNHNSASLVYKLTALGLDRTDVKRETNMDDNYFSNIFLDNQAYLRDHCEVSFHEIENDEKQAILEILFSLRFPSPLNDWKTH